MLNDDKAVSPVIAEILMIAVVIIIAVFVAVYTYNLLGSVTEKGVTTIVIEGAQPGASNITIAHVGGKAIRDAFAPSSPPSYFVNDTIFKNLIVKINGSTYEGWASLNGGEVSKPDFEAGDELRLGLGWKIHAGDSITVIYTPTGDILQRVKVM